MDPPVDLYTIETCQGINSRDGAYYLCIPPKKAHFNGKRMEIINERAVMTVGL